MNPTIKFNVNDYVLVRLTDAGRAELRRQHEEFLKNFASTDMPYREPKEDVSGWSKWQLHKLMNELGAMCTMTSDPPFETEIKICIKSA